MNRPAEMSSAIDSAICAVTSDVRKRAAPRPPDSLPELLRSSVTRSGRVLCSAGTMPNTSPVPSDSTAAKISTGMLRLNCIVVAICGGSIAVMPASVQCATTMLTMPPSTREQDRFGEQLRDQLTTRRAERQAHGHLHRAVRGAREQQVGDVGAGDQQDDRR